jgi:RNA polymerase sigma-70 factor (ECF subfamily)
MTNGPRATTHVPVRPAPLGADARSDGDWSRLRDRLVAFAVKLAWNRQDAEDVAQEAFRLALSSRRLPHERFEAWMFRTVANLCLNLRRRGRPERLEEWVELSGAETPHAAPQRAEQLDRLRTAIAGLPELQRVALVLRTMEQMSYLDIAEVMALSVSAVRTHVHLARRRLAEELGERGDSHC